MKVTLDLDRLLSDGAITTAEHTKLSQLATNTTGQLAFNLLTGFGVIAVAGGALALFPTATTATIVGLCVLAAGLALFYVKAAQWQLVANIFALIGAVMAGIGVIITFHGALAAVLSMTAFLALAGILSESVMLVVLATLMLSTSVGAGAAYTHATYFVALDQPTLTIVLFGAITIGLYHLSKRLPCDYTKLANAAARTGVFLINLGFWIGSLWGDTIYSNTSVYFSMRPVAFAIVWAVALLATGIWAWSRGRRWVLNIVTAFAAIHFFTQWFEHLSASPGSVVIAGLIALGLAFGMRYINTLLQADPPASS